MKAFTRKPLQAAFTLIELLIVVAIIAILAAIAVPNFLEAQTRSKVSRCAADMRTIRTGLETYRVDSNHYPETDYGAATSQAGAGLDRLTTPISYMTSIPRSPFKEDKIGGAARHAISRVQYLYVRAEKTMGALPSGHTSPDASLPNGVDDLYETDRITYISMNSSPTTNFGVRATGFWELKSVGPNNLDDRDISQSGLSSANDARPYDPTNGTISQGDVVVFGDTQGFAKGPQ